MFLRFLSAAPALILAALASACRSNDITLDGNPVKKENSKYAELSGDTLRIGNSLIERTFLWNGGNLVNAAITDRTTGRVFQNISRDASISIGTGNGPGENGRLELETVQSDGIRPGRLEATVTCTVDGTEFRRVFRIYDGCPAIACDNYVQGAAAEEISAHSNAADRKNIESTADMKQAGRTGSRLETFSFDGLHWQTRTVEFSDVTDWNNNLVAERNFIPYRKTGYRGNLLFARDSRDGNGFFILKEAPCPGAQVGYGGSDFVCESGTFTVTGTGAMEEDLKQNGMIRLYSCVTGVYGQGELAALKALRNYQKHIREHHPDRDEMIMMNTWGDRSQDSKVNEQFCIAELEKAARLGVTHFQIDDGWQEGKSPNSAVARGSFRNIWENPLYWTPALDKYPDGLKPVVDKAEELGIKLGLWFNPSIQNDFEDWEKDAGAVIRLYRDYGIRVFKIDGLSIPNKRAEENLRKFFDKVLEETGNEVVFNVDVTAGRRGGYNMLNEYGNIFLENRYTDWRNYYPYWTLRNIWQLSRYVPAERIQVEFLNKWRNTDKYKGDPFAPAGYSFDYVFATAMAGQPLAWMEASNLPEEAYGTASLIRQYKEVAAEFHEGIILPVGEEPSGRSWTGFQSISPDGETGFIIVYRERNDRVSAGIRTWLPENSKVLFTKILGDGRNFRTMTGENGRVVFRLDSPDSFAMYRYSIRQR
ncbi:MAG: alpha-galactosidase [Bacteroidales bacterium]|nr:alpha-galactosidase [Bacteroidales bacterium]